MIHLLQAAYPAVKRCIDMLGAAILLVFLLPVMVGLYIAVSVTSEGPALFWSQRVGRKGRTFNMPKFRTMTVGSKVMARELATDDDCRLTPIGGLLRKSSLDELPQLWSIILGHMSFIGPRPLLPCDEGSVSRQEYAEIANIRPGITGLAQVNGRNLVNPRDKARYDVFYARRVCLILDVKILLPTFKILTRTEMVK